jgi:hypothetical protein
MNTKLARGHPATSEFHEAGRMDHPSAGGLRNGPSDRRQAACRILRGGRQRAATRWTRRWCAPAARRPGPRRASTTRTSATRCAVAAGWWLAAACPCLTGSQIETKRRQREALKMMEQEEWERRIQAERDASADEERKAAEKRRLQREQVSCAHRRFCADRAGARSCKPASLCRSRSARRSKRGSACSSASTTRCSRTRCRAGSSSKTRRR